MPGPEEQATINIIKMGQVQEALTTALRLIHNAMGLAPLGMDQINDLGEAASAVALCAHENQQAINRLLADVRRRDQPAEDQPAAGEEGT